VGCNEVELSESCEDSQYLLLCLDCSGCEQCFACVGLRGESYCVLNKRYSRKDYFQLVQALKKRLEEIGGALLPELAAAARGSWAAGAAGTEFVVEAGRVKGVVDATTAVEVEEESPWAEGVVPLRAEGASEVGEAGGGTISRVPPA
jgi:hypothetical protein